MIASAPGVGELPNVADPAVAIVSIEHRYAANTAEQRSVADAMVAGWAQEPWPQNLGSVSCFVSVDAVVGAGFLRGTEAGESARLGVMTFAQWTNAPVTRPLHTYELYRSHESATPVPPLRRPGCVVFVTIDFDGPDRRR